MKIIYFTMILLALCLTANAQWIQQQADTTDSLRGLSVVNERVVWASGSGGTVLRTINGGGKWNVMKVPNAEKLDFRDIEAFDANTAYILSIGNGESSRIYKTTDGGATWQLQFRNTDLKAFFDAVACWDKNNCISMSDPVDGKYVLLSTQNGGANWKLIDTKSMPAAKDGEAAFAASGTCLITQGKDGVFLVSGGSDARVFRSTDRGKTWTVSDAPIVNGTAASGIFSIAMRNSLQGTIVGGNYEKPKEITSNLAFTGDGGKSWYAGKGLGGYRSSVAWVGDRWTVAVGTSGSDISYDTGGTWKSIDNQSYNTVQAKGKNAVWAVGDKGMVAKMK